MDKIPFGIPRLDRELGGFPAGSLILVAGNPGTGKTVFAANFIHYGATKLGEKGVYASFAEGKEQFLAAMKGFGLDFERLEKEGKIRFLDLAVMRREAAHHILEQIVEEVSSLGAKRLVIDSFSALSLSFLNEMDARSVLHLILGKIIRRLGCTTLLLFEGEEVNGEPSSYVADGIIILTRDFVADRLLRKMRIIKMRGLEVNLTSYPFTLHRGFNMLEPEAPEIPREKMKFELLPVREGCLSTGFEELDKITGGVKPGECAVLNVDGNVYISPIRLVRPAICQAVMRGHGVFILPPRGESGLRIRSYLLPFLGGKAFNKYVRVADYGTEVKARWWLALEGRNARKDFDRAWKVMDRLRKETGKPILSIMGWDTVEYMYGSEATARILGFDTTRVRNKGDVRINITRPSGTVVKQLSDIADHIFLCINEDGITFSYSTKRYTPFYGFKTEFLKDRIKVRLIPVV